MYHAGLQHQGLDPICGPQSSNYLLFFFCIKEATLCFLGFSLFFGVLDTVAFWCMQNACKVRKPKVPEGVTRSNKKPCS